MSGNKQTADAVRTFIMNEYNKGTKANIIAQKLREQGFQTAYGLRWNASRVNATINNCKTRLRLTGKLSSTSVTDAIAATPEQQPWRTQMNLVLAMPISEATKRQVLKELL